MQAGVSYVPENRLDDAAFLNMPVSANLSAAAPREFYSGARFARKAERAANLQLIERYSIKIPSLSAPMAQLSGGNQQKVILARCMRRSPKLLLLDEPTQGVDVGARADIHDYIRAAVSAQASAVFVSSDFEELVLVCDRVLVIRDGEVANVVARGSLTSELLEELSHSSTARRADGLVQN
jgi:ribose transport system ATP-binding protein